MISKKRYLRLLPLTLLIISIISYQYMTYKIGWYPIYQWIRNENEINSIISQAKNIWYYIFEYTLWLLVISSFIVHFITKKNARQSFKNISWYIIATIFSSIGIWIWMVWSVLYSDHFNHTHLYWDTWAMAVMWAPFFIWAILLILLLILWIIYFIQRNWNLEWNIFHKPQWKRTLYDALLTFPCFLLLLMSLNPFVAIATISLSYIIIQYRWLLYSKYKK